MTNIQEPPASPEDSPGRTNKQIPGSVTPLVPRPVVTIIAIGVVGILLWHIWYDAHAKDYDGWQVTIFLGSLVFFILGADVSKWLRGGGKP